MKKLLITLLTVLVPSVLRAQYIPAFKTDTPANKNPYDRYWHKGNLLRHLEVSLTAGTTGFGLDVATTITEQIQIRVGYDYLPNMSRSHSVSLTAGGEAARKYDGNGMRIEGPFDRIREMMYQETGYDIADHVDLEATFTYRNFKFLVDFYPFRYNKNWHFTAGAYFGKSQFGEVVSLAQSATTLMLMSRYNKEYDAAPEDEKYKQNGRVEMYWGDYSHDIVKNSTIVHKVNDKYLMEGGTDGLVRITAKGNVVRPYLGFGYGGLLLPKRADWKVWVECGTMLLGPTTVKAHDGTDLGADVKNYKAMKHTIEICDKLTFYPVLSVRIAKTLF